ncbi:hypothetical protein P0D69_28005 [Paraburkholderia sediminicola]|uniref:hypothetical protein n=1 Tax=Paraburkholderia sediminicola TaxID=458836 RepID=UPI0038B98B4E
MYNFSIIYKGAKVAHAEAARFEDARANALYVALKGEYASALPYADFEATHDTSVISKVTGPLFL